MNENILKGKWKQLTGEVQKRWGKLTNDDVDRINGNYQMLVGRVQERYGIAMEDAQTQVADWMHELNERMTTSES